MNFAPRPSVGSIPVRKSGLPVHRFRVGAKRLRRRRELDAKFFQPLLGAGRPRAFASYHLPACAPPSTCNISPVVKVASIKNKTASATSLTSPILPTGCNPLRNSWVSGLRVMAIATSRAGRNLMAAGSDDERSQGGRHVPNDAPTVPSSVLDQDIAGRQHHLRAIVELECHVAGE